MPERSYGQYCGLTAALDIVGERWSLLIVRDLSLGPMRSIDLIRALPGIPTNVLHARLAKLRAAGIVARRVTPPPTPATLYELTTQGEQLEAALDALDDFGARRLGRIPARTAIRPEAIDFALRRLMRRLAGGAAFALEVRIADRGLSLIRGIRRGPDNDMTISDGSLDSPDALLRADARTFFRLAAGAVTLRGALADEGARLDGRAATLRRLLAAVQPERPRSRRTTKP